MFFVSSLMLDDAAIVVHSDMWSKESMDSCWTVYKVGYFGILVFSMLSTLNSLTFNAKGLMQHGAIFSTIYSIVCQKV